MGIVLNTDEHTEEGRHWKVVYIEKGKEVEIYKYDSSKGKEEKEVKRFIEGIRSELSSSSYKNIHVHEDENAHVEQKSTSECGMYSIVFLLERVRQKRLLDVDSPIPAEGAEGAEGEPKTKEGRPEKRGVYDDLQISQLRLQLFNHHDGHAR